MKENFTYLKDIRSRKGKDKRIYIIIAIASIFLLMLVSIIWAIKTKNNKKNIKESISTLSESSKSEEVTNNIKTSIDYENIFNTYSNLGIVNIDSSYLNVRKEAGKDKDLVGKLYAYSAVDILGSIDVPEQGTWYNIKSGNIEGYVLSDNILTGEEAKKVAKDNIKERAIVLVDELRVRKEANENSQVIDVVKKDERYEVIENLDSWIKIRKGYISKDYVEIKFCLDEAVKYEPKAMVLNEYKNLGISVASGYVNIRKEPKLDSDSNIIGKLPNGAAADILEAKDSWYKIKSGPVTGYVSADYIKTGEEAKEIALSKASLVVVVKEPLLNVRTEPNTSSKIWTQITNAEKYPVVKQLDGWVEIELEDDNNTYVSAEHVDIKYALNEAVKFNPNSASEGSTKQSASASKRASIVNYALQFLGNPYVWGGTSLTKGCDCSGFTMQVLAKFGYGLPHYSVAQSKMGKKVDSSSMRPGDLIFYANSSGRINHVSMYIGNGQVVHAASRRSGIKISTWNYRKPVSIRNIIGD